MKKDLVIIGGGAAGLSAAIAAKDPKLNILLIERDNRLGGILNQCIHSGFGLHMFNEELTGPEYANRFIEELKKGQIDVMLNTTVIDIKKEDTFNLTLSNIENGLVNLNAKAVIIASGCYERTRGQVCLPGTRPKGIMTAGSAQRYLNMDGYLVGKKVFILGSGDIGLIMARRFVLEGAEVLGVAEIMPYSNGLPRNILQCLDDFNIPLYLSHTITDIKGIDKLESITISQVDDNFCIIEGTEKNFDVDTLLLSVGLIPDIGLFDEIDVNRSEITRSMTVDQNYMSSVAGLYICGNALHVHDLVDFVSIEGEKVGLSAKTNLLNPITNNHLQKEIKFNDNIRYTVPQRVDFNNLTDDISVFFRVNCKIDKAVLTVYQGKKEIMKKRLRYLQPAIMQNIIIKKKDLIGAEEILINLEEA